jgi:hypothetical protein
MVGGAFFREGRGGKALGILLIGKGGEEEGR